MIFPKPLSVAIATLSAWLVIGQAPGLAPAAQANPAHDQRLAKGEIVVDLISKHPIYHFDVYGVVDGTPEQVWEVITDYHQYRDFLPLVSESNVRKRHNDTVYQYVQMSPPWPFHKQWMVNACKEEKARWTMSWTMSEGNVKLEHGYWRLTPLPDGKTKLQYHLTVDPWMDHVPSWVVETVTRSVMPDIVKGIRKRVATAKQAKR